MPESSDELTAISVRNQILLERLKSGEYKKFAPFLRRIERDVRNRIGDEGDTIATKKRLNVLLTDVQRIQKEIYDEYIAQLNGDLGSIAVSQSEFEANSYNKVVANYNATVPAAEQVLASVRLNPLQIKDYAGDPLIEPYMRDWSRKETARVTSAIQQGFYQGQTNAEIVRSIRGTKALNYRDGVLDISNRSAFTIVRTSVQHAASQARQATMKANSDLIKGYKWVSTLDSRTSDQCASLDGRRFDIGEGPLPPIHPNACIKGTLITTIRGLVPIEDVKVGDYALTHMNEYKRVNCVMAKENDTSVLELINNFGERVRLTNDHPVLTVDGWKKAGDIKVGDKVFNNPDKLVWSKHWLFGSLVKQEVLIDSHNIETQATKELIPYKISSFTAGVSSSINLKNNFATYQKVRNVVLNCWLKIVRYASFVK
jgi:SPP1 gp7 family putative phage head morphogenesis protein